MFQYLVLFLCQCQMLTFINVDVDFMEDGEFFELESSEYLITQKINNATFYFTVGSFDIPRYIFLEIYFSYPKDGDVNFLTTVGKNQLTKLENSNIITTYADYNGFYLNKNYHNIVIPANSFKTGDKFFITNLIRNDRRQYQYTLKLRKLPYQPCPNNCSSGSGRCVDGTCSCNKNILDLDCSKKAIALEFDQKIENVTIFGTQYLYFEQITQLGKIKLEISLQDNYKQEQAVILLYYMFENYKYGIPTQFYKNVTLTKDEMIINTIIIDISQLNFNSNLLRFDRLIFKLQSENDVNCSFLITSISSDDQSADTIQIIIYVTTSIASFIIILIIVFIVIRCKKTRRRIQQIIPSNYLSLEFLKKYMQKAKKKNCNSDSDSLQCSICLQDNNKDELRLTHCQHVFHFSCLFNWFNKSNGKYLCPNCRTTIDLEKMKQTVNKIYQKQQDIQSSIEHSQDHINN